MQNLILNRYRVIDTAGRGGFATVQVAWDTRIQRRVAIKCLPLEGKVGAGQPAGSSGVDAVQIPGLDEARTAAMLSDPNIVGVYDFEVADGMAYMIMEYVDGVTLTRFMRDFGGPLPLDVIATVFGAVSHALEFAHENQVLHLDIKPDNVMINRQGQVKVTDFGLAELSHGAGFGQATGGTIGYMPLEQMRLEAPDERTDEWALAALTYEMFTGDNPFFAPDLDRAEAAIEDAELVVPSLARGDVHPAIDDILFDALSIDRDGRFESVAAFAEALEPYLGDPRKGMRQLAVLVGEACEDYEEAAAAEGPDARMPLDFLSDRARSALYRVFSATACAGLGMLSLANIPQLFAPVAVAGANAVTAADAAALAGAAGSASAAGSVAAAGSASAAAGAAAFAGPPTAVFFGLAALLALGALISPPLGALLSVLLLAAALFCNGAHVMAVAVAAAGVAWWYFSGRGSSAAASSGVAPMWFGALGFGALAPLACGYVLRVRDAAICSAFAFLLAFVLACSGSMSVFDWGALVNWRFSNHMEATAVAMLASPGTWISLAAWVGAACVFAASCIRGTRPVAFMGAVAASALLIGGVMLSAWFASGMVSCAPPLWTIVPVSVSCAAAVAATFAGVPWKERAR